MILKKYELLMIKSGGFFAKDVINCVNDGLETIAAFLADAWAASKDDDKQIGQQAGAAWSGALRKAY